MPADWANPLTPDLISAPPEKDLLREDRLPIDVRVRLLSLMDRWQLCQFVLSLVLPLRPEEAAGLLVGDVDFAKGWLSIGTRADGDNFTKARKSFKLPFPSDLKPILAACIGGRSEGPLLRSRRAFEHPREVHEVEDHEGLMQLYRRELRASHSAIHTEQDRKQAFRGVLRVLGGVSTDRMGAEFKALLASACVTNSASLYSLRASVTTAMNDANLPHLDMRYLTGHRTNDILNDYARLDPSRAMATYFEAIRPLLHAISAKAAELGLGR